MEKETFCETSKNMQKSAIVILKIKKVALLNRNEDSEADTKSRERQKKSSKTATNKPKPAANLNRSVTGRLVRLQYHERLP